MIKEKTNKKISLFISLLSVFFVLVSGCASTQKKDKATTAVMTNQPDEQVSKSPIKIAPQKVEPVEIPKKTTTELAKAIPVKPVIKKPTKHVKAKVENQREKVREVTKMSLPELTLTSLKQLPLNLNNGWFLALKTLPLTMTETCVLYREKNGFFDGYKDNNIKLYLTMSQLLIKSDSNFDLSYPETGVYVENKDNDPSFYPLVLSPQITIASLVLPLSDYIESSSKQLVVKSGFWPSWPITETRTVMFALTEVDSMIKSLSTCTAMLSAP